MEQFPFGNIVKKFSKPLVASWKTDTTYADNGTEIPPEKVTLPFTGALVPFSNNQLRYSLNGTYTAEDRQLFTMTELRIGAVVEVNGIRYTIDREADYKDFTDVCIYYCKAVYK